MTWSTASSNVLTNVSLILEAMDAGMPELKRTVIPLSIVFRG